MGDTLRVGIVGTGGMANRHAERFSQVQDVEVATCLDVDAERAGAFAAKHSIEKVASNADELLELSDAVAIVTPDRYHAEWCLRAFEAGKHVLCEKPLTVTLDDAKRVADAARASDRMHMTNFSYRESAAFQAAIAVRKSGRLGFLRHVHALYLQSWLGRLDPSQWPSGTVPWRLQASQANGVLGDLGCHILDMATATAGSVRRIRCDLRTFPKVLEGQEVTEMNGQPVDANDTAAISIEFADGAFGLVQTTRWATGHNNQLRCEVHGTLGAVRFDLEESYHRLHVFEDGKWTTEELERTPDIYDRFITAIRSGERPEPDLLRGAEVQAMLDACERSAESDRWETVETV
jgi:predicted dehydrogenase